MQSIMKNLGTISVCLAALVLCTANGLCADASKGKEQPGPAKTAEKQADAPQQGQLDPAMVALRDRVRRVLAQSMRQPINTGDNTPAEVLNFCLAFGCDAEIRYGNSAGNAINGIGCLCFGYPCAGYQLLAIDQEQRIMPRVGYGLQTHPSEMLAVLAQSAVPANYEVRVGERKGSVADLVAYEKLTCRSGDDLSYKLIGLTFYATGSDTWKNEIGQEWSLERLLKEELAREPSTATCEITDHLMGLSWAIQRRMRANQPLDGQYRRAEKYVADFQQYALGLENADGSWHPGFFASKGTSRDASGLLRSTGHILEWLVFSLPGDQLKDPRVVKSVGYVTSLLEESYARWNATATTAREVDSVGHALHALQTYDKRIFKPHDPAESESSKPAEAKTSERAGRAAKTR
jgi:hypothetical protein